MLCVHWRVSWVFRGTPSVYFFFHFYKYYSIHSIVLFTLPSTYDVGRLDSWTQVWLGTDVRCSPADLVVEGCCAGAVFAILNNIITSGRNVLDVCLPWEGIKGINNTLRLDKYRNTCRPLQGRVWFALSLLLRYWLSVGISWWSAKRNRHFLHCVFVSNNSIGNTTGTALSNEVLNHAVLSVFKEQYMYYVN